MLYFWFTGTARDCHVSLHCYTCVYVSLKLASYEGSKSIAVQDKVSKTPLRAVHKVHVAVYRREGSGMQAGSCWEVVTDDTAKGLLVGQQNRTSRIDSGSQPHQSKYGELILIIRESLPPGLSSLSLRRLQT